TRVRHRAGVEHRRGADAGSQRGRGKDRAQAFRSLRTRRRYREAARRFRGGSRENGPRLTMIGESGRESKLCAVSVDLDEIPFYHQIHGLSAPDERSAHLVFDVALERLERLARSFAMPLTFFAIGSTLARAVNAAKPRALAAA